MAEYINRDLVYRAVADVMSYNDVPLQRYDSLIDVVGSIPPADVRPVVRGRWMAKNWILESETGEVEVPYNKSSFDQWDCFCSECGISALLDGCEREVPSNFCPNCGADMREKAGP